MNLRSLFKKPGNTLEGGVKPPDKSSAKDKDAAKKPSYVCPRCGGEYDRKSLMSNSWTCPHCGGYFRLSARRRLRFICDEGTFCEHDAEVLSKDILDFPGYARKLAEASEKSSAGEGVVCGRCKIGGHDCCIFSMDPNFMMGSMGSAVGERLCRLFEYAAENALPVVGFTVSGGARMQEGIVSLMQMAKVSGAVKLHSDSGGLYMAVLTNPTTGGVTASFAMLGDIVIAEPGALIGFAGPRVIEQTIRGSLPEGFQRSEFLLEHGFLDAVVERSRLRDYIIRILDIHCGKKPDTGKTGA